MIRAGKFVLALSLGLSWVSPAAVLAQGPYGDPQYAGPAYDTRYGTPNTAGAIYADPNCEPAAYVADPGEPDWVDPALIERQFNQRAIFDNWFVRTEYLNWTISDLSDRLLGSPVAGIDNPRLPQQVTDPTTGALLGIAIVPDTHLLQLRANNGIRVTTGADLVNGGRFEVNGFLLEKATSQFTLFGNVLGDPNAKYDLIATSTYVNDQLAANYETYNHSFEASYESRLWGAGADYFFDVDRDGVMQFMPTVGLRYISINEQLFQKGIFRDTIFGGPPSGTSFVDEVSTIHSKTWNNVAIAQIGFRQEFVVNWFSIGVDPRVGVGFNSAKARVIADNFLGGQDPVKDTKVYDNHVSLMADVHAYVKARFNQHVAIQAGYNFLWLNQITRPEDNIYYNEIQEANGNVITDVRVRTSRHTWSAEGFTAGIEFTW